MADIRERVPLDELLEEQREIEDVYMSMRFAQKIRSMSLACFKSCGGKPMFPFMVDQNALVGRANVCFGDCMNINLEKGPFLSELGEVPEDAIPKKFLWSHSL